MFRIVNPTPFYGQHPSVFRHPTYYDPEDLDEDRYYCHRPSSSPFDRFSQSDLEQEYLLHQQRQRQIEMERQRERARAAAIQAELERRRRVEEEERVKEILRQREVEKRRREFLNAQRLRQQQLQRERQRRSFEEIKEEEEGGERDLIQQLFEAFGAPRRGFATEPQQHQQVPSRTPAPSPAPASTSVPVEIKISAPASSPVSPQLSPEAKQAGLKILTAIRENLPRLKSLKALHRIQESFQTLTSSPDTLEALAVPPEALEVDVEKRSLAVGSKKNLALVTVEERLTRLLVEADGVESWGSELVRGRRKEVVKSVFGWVEKVEELKRRAVEIAAGGKGDEVMETEEEAEAEAEEVFATPASVVEDEVAAASPQPANDTESTDNEPLSMESEPAEPIHDSTETAQDTAAEEMETDPTLVHDTPSSPSADPSTDSRFFRDAPQASTGDFQGEALGCEREGVEMEVDEGGEEGEGREQGDEGDGGVGCEKDLGEWEKV
ncbi:hypothetical protein HDU97_007548 [Phlyctochytrium planicorne]|nr:hypothetical protein HDU97_007548 [Phlyctochytrium planicorne]